MIESMECSTNYRNYASRLRRLDALMKDNNDAEEADSLRDEMDTYYYKLEPFEIQRLKDLSTDLNSLDLDPDCLVVRPWDEDFGRRLEEALRSEDPESIRGLLRSPLEYSEVACWVRFLYWSRLGDRESARPFAQSILAFMEADLFDFQQQLFADGKTLIESVARSNGSDAEDLRQRATHFLQSNEHFQSTSANLRFLRSRIGSGNEATLTQDFATSLIAFRSEVASILQAA